jgi:hypothetical protein
MKYYSHLVLEEIHVVSLSMRVESCQEGGGGE